jgi:hypothetical protein
MCSDGYLGQMIYTYSARRVGYGLGFMNVGQMNKFGVILYTRQKNEIRDKWYTGQVIINVIIQSINSIEMRFSDVLRSNVFVKYQSLLYNLYITLKCVLPIGLDVFFFVKMNKSISEIIHWICFPKIDFLEIPRKTRDYDLTSF